MEALLANDCPLPILIVFCTNHTLDRFLEGVLKFCNAHDVLRVSTNSTSVGVLAKCNLSSIKSKLKLEGEAGDMATGKCAKIIGMTTTAAAKYRHIIDASQPKITSKSFGYLI